MEETKFIPDYTKKKLTMTLEMYEGASLISIKTHNGHTTNYLEIVGMLETQKASMMLKQSLRNQKEWKEFVELEKAEHKESKKKK